MKSNNFEQESYWEKFVDVLSEAILILDLSGKILYANQSACALLDKKIFDIIGSDFSYPIELEKPTEIEILGQNYKITYAEVTMRNAVWKNNPASIVTLHDITDRKENERKLNVLANVFTFAKEGILVTDTDLNIIDVNDEFTHITQYTKEEVIGKKPNILKSGIQDSEFYKKMWVKIKNDNYWYGEIWNKRKNNETYPQLLSISAVRNADGELINYIGVFYDITQQELQKKQLMHIAYHDSLTNLANRTFLMDRLEITMKNTLHSTHFIALIFIDIDNFKKINELYGHKIGDLVLIKTSEIIKKSIRETDTLARLSGDQFVLLAEGLMHADDYKNLINKIYGDLQNPLIINSKEFFITLSSGISIYPQKTFITPGEFLSQSNQAMYKSKLAGKNKYSMFDIELDSEIREQEKLISEIKSSISNNELKLYYQPKVNMKTGKILGLEGLIRWNHPTKGLLQPDQFLPKIKNDAFLFELSEFTLKLALDQIKTWKSIDDQLTISVNVSAIQLEQENFFEKLKSIVSSFPKNIYERLELEILESSNISKFELTSDIIKKCNSIGIQFSLDDFGTKYSSLNYLVNLPFRYMKIDAGFVINAIHNTKDTNILKAMIDIAKAIDISIIAEGVETQDHLDYLVNLGCILGQGYAISKPMPPEQFPQWYQSWNKKFKN